MTPVYDLLLPVSRESDILPNWQGTPIGDLLRYHNLGAPYRDYTRAELLIGMCMDNRKSLRVPDNFAFILRAGGANLRRVEFKVSFAIALGGVRAICLIGHDDCGMVSLPHRRQEFIDGLVANGGWTPDDAAAHYDRHAAEFGIGDAAEFVRDEAVRLRARYPRVLVAPLFYTVGDGLLHQILER
ncbi:MAG: carbonic anhydrase [Candidatus Zixiibacteriota bacterium]